MTKKSGASLENSALGLRLKAGITLLVLSIAVPLLGLPVVTTLGFSATVTASVSGALLLGGEIVGILAVAVMGKDGYTFVKNRVFGFLKQYLPPGDVSRIRYNLGLVMFSVPILFGWVSIYAAKWFPAFINSPMPFAVGGDILLLASFFVLGGNFWDKIQALFTYDSEVYFAKS